MKMFHAMLTAYAILVLCNAVLQQRLQATFHREKIRQFRECRLNNIWSRSLHMYISRPVRQKKKLPAAQQTNQQPVKLLVGHYLKNFQPAMQC